MLLEDEMLVATVANVTRRRYGTVLRILVELKRSDEGLGDLDEDSVRAALDRLVDAGLLRRGPDALYSLPR